MKRPRIRKRDLIGRRIVAVDFRFFRGVPGADGTKGPTYMDPCLTLDNGRRVYFIAKTIPDCTYFSVEVQITPRPAKATQ